MFKQEDGDNKVLKLRFDVSQYAPEEIVVKTVDQKLLVSYLLDSTNSYSQHLYEQSFELIPSMSHAGPCQTWGEIRHKERLPGIQSWIHVAKRRQPRTDPIVVEQRRCPNRWCTIATTIDRRRNIDTNQKSLNKPSLLRRCHDVRLVVQITFKNQLYFASVFEI